LGRIGPQFFDAQRVEGEARGIVASVAEYGLDGVDPVVAAFFEDTASLELTIRSEWRWPFSWLWRVGRRVMRWNGQFVYPLREGTIVTRVFPIAGKRAVIRTYVDGGAMQSVAYDVWRGNMRAWFPLPGGGIRGVLAPSQTERGVMLSSKPRGAGVWLVIGPLAIPAPLGEVFELWPEDGVLVGRHVQSMLGIRFATHHYRFHKLTPSPSEPGISRGSKP